MILETEDDALIECTVQWLSMYHKTIQKKIMERVVKKKEEEEKDAKVEEDQEEPAEPTVPAPTMSTECQTDESFLTNERIGRYSQEEEPVSPEGSVQPEESGEPQADIQKDDTAPKPEPAKRLYYDVDITGNEDDSVFRKLEQCFPDGHYGEWAGFYGQGYPVSTKHRHMFWHVKYRKTQAPHKNHWYTDTDDQLMTEYIARHKDEYPLSVLEEIRNTCEYGCSDPHFIHINRNTQSRHQRMQNPELEVISIPWLTH